MVILVYEEFLSINKERLEQYKKDVILEMRKLDAKEEDIEKIPYHTFLNHLYNDKSPIVAAKEIAKIERKYF